MALELGIKLTANTSGFTSAINSASKALSDTLSKSIVEAKVSLNQLDPAIQDAVQGIDLMNFDQVSAAMNKFVSDGNLLSGFLERVKGELGSVDDQQAFTELSQVIKLAEDQLKNLSATENANTNTSKSLKTQLREMREELARMEAEGLRGTEAYNKLAAQAGHLRDSMDDAAGSIRTMASDTRALDAGVDIANGLTGAFQAYQGALSLTGLSNEDAAKSLQKLMAVMSVAQGIQQVGTFLTGQSAGLKVLDTTVTYAQSVAYRVLGTSMTTASAATRGFATALAATGIGAIVVAIGLAVSALMDFVDTSEEAEAATKKLNDELERQSQILDLDLASLDRFNKKRIAELKASGATEQQIFVAENQARQDDLNRLRQALTEKNKAYNDQLKNRYADSKQTQKIFEEKTKLEEQIANKETEIIVAGYDYIKKTEDKRVEQETKHNADLKKAGEDRVKIIQDNEKKLQSALDKTRSENLRTNIDELQKELDARKEAGINLGSEEATAYKFLQDTLFNLKKQEIDAEYNAQRKSLIELGALTTTTGKEALAELEKQYNAKVLKIQLEVQPITSLKGIDLNKGVEGNFGKIQLPDNTNFLKTLNQQLGTLSDEAKNQISNFWSKIGAEIQNGAINIGPILSDALISVADTIGNVLGSGGTFGQALSKAGEMIFKILGSIFQNIGKELIFAGKLKVLIDKTLAGLFGPQGGPMAIAAGFALVTLGSLMKNIKLGMQNVKAFATGGIVTGPTLGMVGEAGKEAIIPLDRIGEVLGFIGGTQNVFVTGQLSGEMIYLQQQRVSQRRGRFV